MLCLFWIIVEKDQPAYLSSLFDTSAYSQLEISPGLLMHSVSVSNASLRQKVQLPLRFQHRPAVTSHHPTNVPAATACLHDSHCSVTSVSSLQLMLLLIPFLPLAKQTPTLKINPDGFTPSPS